MESNKKPGARERILDVANRLFYEDGVRATGTEKIMSIAGVAKATFYRHFESKDALVLAYLDLRDKALWNYLSTPTPVTTIDDALTRMEQMANHPEIIGCPFLLIASEFPDTTHPFHIYAINHKNKLKNLLETLLKTQPAVKAATATKLLGIIDGAFCARMIYGTVKEITLLPAAEAILKDTI